MDTSVNTRPLLQQSETDSDFESDLQVGRSGDNLDDDVLVVTRDTKPLFKSREPNDRFNFAYVIFYFLGTTMLLPWFFFITAEEYWMYKFRDLSVNLTSVVGGGHSSASELQASFSSYISLASTVPSTIFLIINPIYSHKVALNLRIVGSLVIMLILFIMTTVFVEVNTDNWQDNFFLLTMGTIVLLNGASAILQSGLFGVVGKFPAQYITATVSGQALGGVLAALADIVSLWLGASPIRSALVYFIMADVFIFVATLSYILLSRTMLFKYYLLEEVEYAPVNQPPIVRHISYTGILKKDSGGGELLRPSTTLGTYGHGSKGKSIIYTVKSPVGSNVIQFCQLVVLFLSYRYFYLKIWVHGMSVWYCFLVFISMYPAITALVSSQYKGNHSAWNDIYFTPVVSFLLLSSMDYLGRIVAGLLQWPERRGWLVALLSFLRTGFFPLLLLCNAQPRHHLPVLVHSDYLYILIVVLFGFSNGYLANITMLNVPKIVDPHEVEVASSMMAAFLGVGLACGSFVGLWFVKLI